MPVSLNHEARLLSEGYSRVKKKSNLRHTVILLVTYLTGPHSCPVHPRLIPFAIYPTPFVIYSKVIESRNA